MSPTPGQRLGAYEISGKLGEGGMGEVYRATDPSLKRDVAIKLLPAAFASDPERLGRFAREAQVLAQLNHPNIAAIYGFHEADGVRFLAMELVPGETLGERIEKGPLPLDDAIVIAKKIAEGLEFAHERGIVHRDLKPANIKLTPDGEVKILDFGLAKAVTGEISGAGSASTPTILPTVTSAGTAIGMILGTAAYMSPEQARGKPVDKRADIWAFGVVLHEMLTGRRLFDGETISDTIAAVLTKPVNVAAAGTIPSALRALLQRCLERDSKLRLRDIGEARIALASTHATTTDAPAIAPRQSSKALFAAIPIVAILALGAGWFLHRPPAEAPNTQQWMLAVPEGYSLSTLEQIQIAISADGEQQVAVVLDKTSGQRLMLRTADQLAPRIIPDTERATSPFFSPDGRWIAFSQGTTLYKIPVSGGPPFKLTTLIGQTRGGTWSRDGYIYFSSDAASPLSRVSEDGGKVEEVTKLDGGRGERTHRWPSVLPDGSAVLFTCDDQSSSEYYDDARIEAVVPSTGKRTIVVEGASMARYAPGDRLIFARGGSLFAVKFDPKVLKIIGGPVPIYQGVATDVSTGAAQFSIAENGSAVWIAGDTNLNWNQRWVSREGVASSAEIAPAPYNELAVSPDGKRVALIGGQGGVADLWIHDFERDSISRLTIGKFVSRPVWSPDGTKLAFGTRMQGPKSQSNTWQVVLKGADSAQDETTLYEGERAQMPSAFTPDGRAVLFDSFDGDLTRRDIRLVSTAGNGVPTTILGGPFRKSMGTISPDGRWLAYCSDEGGSYAVYVRPYPSGTERWQISIGGGTEPHWAPSGDAIFYRADGIMFRVPIDTAHGLKAGRPERIFEGVGRAVNVSTYGVAPDGQHIFTFVAPAGLVSVRTVNLDLGFAKRAAEVTSR